MDGEKIDDAIDNLYQGDASGKIGFADPWRNHFYIISDRVVNYIRKEISPGSNTIDEGNTITQKGANVNTTM